MISWNTLVLDKPVVAYLNIVFHAFYKTRIFFHVFIKLSNGIYSKLVYFSSRAHNFFFCIHFNIILPPTRKAFYFLLYVQFFPLNLIFLSYNLHVYLYHPHQRTPNLILTYLKTLKIRKEHKQNRECRYCVIESNVRVTIVAVKNDKCYIF
jgi:hypothetical protein